MVNRKTEDKIVHCIMCDKNFTIRVRKSDGLIMSKCFHATPRLNFFLKWTWEIIDTKQKDFLNSKNCRICFKNTFWKVVGYTAPQRWIIYKIWWLFKGWQKWSYYECSRCSSS